MLQLIGRPSGKWALSKQMQTSCVVVVNGLEFKVTEVLVDV